MTPMAQISYQRPSSRELEVLNLIADELTINEIATTLFISPETVKTHRKHLMRKMDVKNTAGLIRRAFERHIFIVRD